MNVFRQNDGTIFGFCNEFVLIKGQFFVGKMMTLLRSDVAEFFIAHKIPPFLLMYEIFYSIEKYISISNQTRQEGVSVI